MTQWHIHERPDPLREDEVHLWITPLTAPAEKLSYFKSILSVDEKERVRRVRKISDGERYLIARGSLRCLLASYVAGAPDRLQFTYGVFGKPSLSNGSSKTALTFS